MEAVKRSLGPSQAEQLDAAIASNTAGFAPNKASFGSALNTYYTPSRCIAREILHVVFFVARGAPTDVIKEDILARVDTIHAMLGLAKDQALIRQGHPVPGEYQAPPSCHPLLVFPKEGKGALTDGTLSRPTNLHLPTFSSRHRIICGTTKMGLFNPSRAAGRNLDAIFA